MIAEIRKRMLVWDSPVFFTHWLLAICFLGAILTQESEKFRLVHVTMGYTMLGIIGFRVIWGFIGSKYARFTTIKPRFLRVRENIQAILSGNKEFSIGLNAVGFVAAYLLMGLVLLVSATGYLVFNEIGPELISEIHELVGNLIIAVVVVHVGSIVLNVMYQRLQKTNGEVAKNVGVLAQRARPYKWVTIIILLVVIYFWGIQFKIW
ncbi:cytochrome b/b6 domain-containing protein [Polynucleobacter victoriensis]|uniref:Cytochrome b n=1 Tax=Polynucleobacter victoriensis TaxID=2049319 RepID=A0A212U1X8_9BURK|nr:cytochrome b/b6 domain-containing protein [Polynucleobacter victoriensis]SNC72262.1 Cytochrome b [Polynucleobacter victoriensis]